MRCSNCFHSSACGSSSPYNDASMCKQYIYRGEVLCGAAYKIVIDDYEKTKERNRQLEKVLKDCEIRQVSIERELELLRIIKQTLEMQSGMKFDV